MQTILGANGVIGTEIARALPQYTSAIRLVSRNPVAVNPGDELLSADLTDPIQTEKAIAGSEVVYLTIGLPYKLKVWETQWPVVMNNVIEGCKKHGAKLVFFDNVYMYGKVNGWMTEETPHHPTSKKGAVRAKIADMILDEVARGTLTAQIVRSADFYGKSPLSVVSVMVFDNYAKGKTAQYMISDKFRHSYTFIPDAGKATALLGNTPDAYNQVWHLPTDKNVLTGKEFMEKTAAAFGVAPKYTVLSKFMLRLVGFFVPVVGESIEMLYQSEGEYLFDSSKFDKRFSFKKTPYQEGIEETVALYNQ
ncbi:MAG: NAD-dependent epimerase/dehydratase family protein [Bacteroidia bacterium]